MLSPSSRRSRPTIPTFRQLQGSTGGDSGGGAPPTPAASFPLNGSLASDLPLGRYEGEAHNVLWRDDAAFGTVMGCDEVRCGKCGSTVQGGGPADPSAARLPTLPRTAVGSCSMLLL